MENAYHSGMSSPRVYLDHASATPMAPAARELLVELLQEPLANPSASHEAGRHWKDLLEAARTRAAKALGCRPRELIFAAGGTEAANIAVHGLAAGRRDASRRVVVSAMEHPAVLQPAEALASDGFELVRVAPQGDGTIDGAGFAEAVGEDAAFAALMLANHEMGAVMPVAQVGSLLRERGIPLLCDASLGPGRLPCRPQDLNADVIVYSGQKFGGPAGTGLLYVRRGTKLRPWMHGGIQEEGLRPGMPFVPGIAAMCSALETALDEQDARSARYRALIDVFLNELGDDSGVHPVGDVGACVPGMVTLELPRVEGEATMINMDLSGFAVATGSTCALGGNDPSPSLLAMGFNVARASSTIRLSVGEGVDDNSMKRAASTLSHIVERLRGLRRR